MAEKNQTPDKGYEIRLVVPPEVAGRLHALRADLANRFDYGSSAAPVARDALLLGLDQLESMRDLLARDTGSEPRR